MKRGTVSIMLGTAVIAAMMIAAVQISFAEDQGATAVYVKNGSVDPITLEMINPSDPVDMDDLFGPDDSDVSSSGWEPVYDEGDAIIITEGGAETRYVCDTAEYDVSNEVFGFFDNEGHCLAEQYECNGDPKEGEYSRLTLPFEWVDGEPTESGQYAEYRFILKKKGDPDAEPIRTNAIKIFIKPFAVVDDIRYSLDDDGSAKVELVENPNMTEYTIRKAVTLDDGKEYPVKHIGKAFGQCEDLESIIIPEGIADIQRYAFLGADNLKEITIPASVTEIGSYAFGFAGSYDFFYGLIIEGRIEGFTVFAKAGSEGARYAKENGFKCVDPEEEAKEKAADAAYANKKSKAAEKAKYTPQRGKITKVRKGKRKMTVKWKKIPKATGYQFRYSMDKSFSKGVRKKTVKAYKTKGLTIRKLKKNKRWYVQVRAYRTVKGRTYYGKWSSKKSVKVR